MFGKSRRELEEVVAQARGLLTSDNLIELQRVVAHARELMRGTVGPAFDTEVICQLEERIDLLHQQGIARSLGPCGNCTGHAFRISNERDVGLGRGRLVVCAGCGLVSTFVARVDELASDQFGPVFEASAHGGPFR